MNFRISGQKITPTTHTRYLGILMDQHLSWDQHLKMLKQKLVRANGLLAKVRYYLSPKLLRTLYFSIFESHLIYGCQIWGQHSNHSLNHIANLQRKAIQIINFKNKYTPVEPLFKEAKIMTLNEIIKSENCLLALHHINQCLLLSLKKLLTIENDLNDYRTRNSVNHQLALPQVKTTNYGLHSIRYRTTKQWNFVQNSLKLNLLIVLFLLRNSLKLSRRIFTQIIQQLYNIFKGV